jgi:hypothetical protein
MVWRRVGSVRGTAAAGRSPAADLRRDRVDADWPTSL